jgi:hypothetical protein
MPRSRFNIFGGYDKTLFPQHSSQELMNLYLVSDERSPAKLALYPTGGLELSHTFGRSGNGRFLKTFKDKLICVCGNNVYLLDTVFSENILGELNTDNGLIDIDNSENEVLIVDGSNGWLYDDVTGAFTKQTQAAFPTLPKSVSFFGSRFLVGFGESNKIGFSEINNAKIWDGNDDFALPLGETVVGLETLKGRLYAFGNFVSQKWYDAGAPPPLPFRKELTDLDIGCAAPRSIAKGEQFLVWLSATEQGVGSVVITDGSQVTRASSQAIDEEFESYERVDDATAFIYKNALGHIFYQINFPTANKSWQFHINSRAELRNRWVELTYKANERHLAESHAYFNSDHYVIDYSDNKLYRRDINLSDDAGQAIKRLLISPTIRQTDGSPYVTDYFRVVVNSGASANYYDQSVEFHEETDAVIFLSVSRDGAKTFGREMPVKIGKIGKFNRKVEWWNLGYSDQFTYKLQFWDKIPIVFIETIFGIQR